MKPAALLRALRPHQWVKNVFVLAALFFSAGEQASWSALDLDAVWRTMLALAAFCLGSSAIYLINDILDVESDRAHPTKRLRPIAAGEVSVPQALVLSAGCVVGALALGFLADGRPPGVAVVVLAYMLLNLAYSVRLKHVVLVDAFCIAGGFILRVLAGGLAAGAQVSHWLFLCTLFLALFLALAKRRAETDLLGDDRAGHRATLMEYDRGFLDQMVTVLAATTILCYAMYTVDEGTIARFGSARLVWTVPFVVFGLGRYMLLVQTQRGGGSPTRILLGADGPFLINALLWVAATGLIVFHVL